MAWLTERLAFLVRACLMYELGFSSATILRLFQGHRPYQVAVRQTVV